MQATRPCSVDDCDKPAKTRGWCAMHYTRWRRHGNLFVKRKPTNPRPRNTCSVAGCDKYVSARGWCENHFKKWQRNGTPTPVKPSAEERFLFHIAVDHSGHWLWEPVGPKGYGTYFVPDGVGSHTLPHRWAYEHFVGPIPQGLTIDHLCERRNCVNPRHLEPVTQQVNSLRSRRREASEQPPPT